ncbi:hypothetical protein TUMEXPCC7403_13900 [Tumidithrix helvetica PCC 7403]
MQETKQEKIKDLDRVEDLEIMEQLILMRVTLYEMLPILLIKIIH